MNSARIVVMDGRVAQEAVRIVMGVSFPTNDNKQNVSRGSLPTTLLP